MVNIKQHRFTNTGKCRQIIHNVESHGTYKVDQYENVCSCYSEQETMAIDLFQIARSWLYTLANQYTQIDMNCENCVIDKIFRCTNTQQWQ